MRVHQATRAPILAKHLWEIAGEATFIGVVDVSEVRGWLGSTGTAHNEVIYSDVRFTALTVLKDSTQLVKDGSFTLSVLGGRFGNRSMRASGVPTLQRGERLIIIAHANAPDIPTYGGTRGVLRVIDNRVYSYVGMPVVGIDDYGISVLPRCDRIRYNRALLPVPTGDASGRPVPPLCAGQDEALSLDVAIRALRDVAGGHP